MLSHAKLVFYNHKNVNWAVPFRLMSAATKIHVTVSQGTLAGVQDALPNGKPFYAFKGIPYAHPPIGKLRFQSPVPLKKFSLPIQDCTKEGSVSFQKDPYSGEIVGSEDCLFLNVYTPDLPESATRKALPVMVWIHGGAFHNDSGNATLYSPEYLLQEDVIVVTLNYRLGPLGFLFFPKMGIKGNAGLKDQLLAIKWVNENIANFNGDPNNITIFGESAGGASVHLHLLSSRSRQYFHKAICQSGTSLMEWVMQRDPVDRTKRLAQLIGCKSESDQDIYDALLKAEPIDFLKNILNSLTADEKRRGLPMAFKPVVERSDSDDAIITESPLKLLKKENSFDKPVIMGYTSHEGIIMLLSAAKKLDIYDKDMARMIPVSLNITQGSTSCDKISNQLKNFYFGNESVSVKTIPQLTDLMTDYHFNMGLNLTAELHSKMQPKSPLYMYRFSFDGDLNIPKRIFNLTDNKGACHGDDMFYLFKSKLMNLSIPSESKTGQIQQLMCRMWTNFAKYSDPTPDFDKSLPCKWTAVKSVSVKNTEYDFDALDIDNETKMIKNPDKPRIDFWRNLYKLWNESFLRPKL